MYRKSGPENGPGPQMNQHFYKINIFYLKHYIFFQIGCWQIAGLTSVIVTNTVVLRYWDLPVDLTGVLLYPPVNRSRGIHSDFFDFQFF